MKEEENLIRCPWCLFAGVREIPGLYKTAYRVELPEGAAVEVRYPIYVCPQCARKFSGEDIKQDEESKE